mmetsp:Transcript_21913/g.85865  ORF Transcript_21913/g.85865 Transcript_21913/m.85865 type:complete len:546 (+) Transcript_21913:62-1699(+)
MWGARGALARGPWRRGVAPATRRNYCSGTAAESKAAPEFPRGHWVKKEHRREFLEGVKRELIAAGACSEETWTQALRTQTLKERGGGALLARYAHSLQQLLRDTYDEELPLHRRVKNHFADAGERRRFMDRVAEAHGVREAADWKRVTVTDMRRMGGGALLRRYGSFAALLTDVYPELAAHGPAAVRRNMPKGYWLQAENRRSFLDGVAAQLGLSSTEDWKGVTSRDVVAMGGGALLNMFSGSLFLALKDAYGEQVVWEDCRRGRRQGYWAEAENRRRFLDGIAAQMGLYKPSDWSRVSTEDVQRRGGGALLTYYPSFWAALKDIYGGEFSQEEWAAAECRPAMPRNYWQQEESVRGFVEKARCALGVAAKEDWYRVSYEQLVQLGGGSLLKRMRLADMLQLAYPDEEWDVGLFSNAAKKSTQRLLLLTIQDVFRCSAFEDHRYCLEGLADPSLPSSVELDVFVPDHNIAFEYNGEHHYEEISHYGALDVYQSRDMRKVEICKRAGVRLITVPFWWDRQVPSLLATVIMQHPSIAKDILRGNIDQ